MWYEHSRVARFLSIKCSFLSKDICILFPDNLRNFRWNCEENYLEKLEGKYSTVYQDFFLKRMLFRKKKIIYLLKALIVQKRKLEITIVSDILDLIGACVQKEMKEMPTRCIWDLNLIKTAKVFFVIMSTYSIAYPLIIHS